MGDARVSMKDALYLSDSPEETTFKYDNQLTSLPVPEIKQSIMKLLDSIKPIATDEEAYRETERKALAFVQDPEVQLLQQLLKKRAAEHKNWLEAWWLEFAYLRSRKPLIPYSNMAAPLPIKPYWPATSDPGPGPGAGVRAQRAALSTYFQLCFWRMLRAERMRPMIHKGVPWSMNQFRYLFNTVRRPAEPKDELVSWFRTVREGPPESTEVIVIHRGHLFAIQPVTMRGSNNACLLGAPQIERQLRQVERWVAERGGEGAFGPGVGSLTTGDRSDWAEARGQLAKVSPKNAQLLERIDKALWVLVLEDEAPANEAQIFAQSIGGEPRNRWADKSISSLAFKNGTFGASADHTPYDGFCTAIMTHYLTISLEECDGRWDEQTMAAQAGSQWAQFREPEPLEFELDTALRLSIEESHEQFRKVASTVDTLHETFKHFGKGLLKEHRLHPEAFVQCAIHAAYFKQHNRMAPAYVTASTRRFHNGRTETCRSCFPEMEQFAKLLATFGCANSSTRPPPALAYDTLKKAVHKFQTVMQDASMGQGCDRHLMGLYLTAMLEGKPIPELFDDELVQRTNSYILSTSCGGYWNVCGGVPPLVEDGYGCFYGIEDHAITFCCTAYKGPEPPLTDLRKFYSNLCGSLVDMQTILHSAHSKM